VKALYVGDNFIEWRSQILYIIYFNNLFLFYFYLNIKNLDLALFLGRAIPAKCDVSCRKMGSGKADLSVM
jgi:hypothetical protein